MEHNAIQTLFLRYGDEFRKANNLSAVQLKAMHDIETCATIHAGFHSFTCDNCGHTEIAYDSCRNRHCPHCQWLKQEIWVDKVMFKLFEALCNKRLNMPECWKDRNSAEELKALAKEKDWVVHAEKSEFSPCKVIEYLGKYIQRVAISNHRIESIDDEKICFSYKDYADKGKRKTMVLSPLEFIRRFMFHILPKRFCKVRYFGILSIKNGTSKLLLCFDLINKVKLPPRFSGLTVRGILELITGRDYSLCSRCKKGHMKYCKPPD